MRRVIKRLLPRDLAVWGLFLLVLVSAGSYAYTEITNNEHNRKEERIAARQQAQQAQQKADLVCIANWANATNTRQQLVTAARAELDAALAQDKRKLAEFVNLLLSPASTDTQRRVALQRYQRALDNFNLTYDRYTETLRKNPIPPAVFHCSDRLNTKKSANCDRMCVSPSPSPSPTPTVTVTKPGVPRTATATVTRSVQAPQQTITITARGAIVTHTQTSTRTVEPKLPNCFDHPVPPCLLTVPR